MTNLPSVGTVYLVGGGPGDPGLLTLRGRECLRLADVVLYDGLVNPALLSHTRATCERTGRAGQTDGGKRLNQAEINERLVRWAKAGKTVVRLKGGDPFLFGRGAEEAAALSAAGIPFEVVPGVTAALAASAYAGVSLTHREHASAVALITGHEDPAKPRTSLDYRSLATFPGTLVFYMGLHRVRPIADALIAAGKSAHTPACVISRGTTPRQRTVTAELADIADRVAAAGLHAPSLIVVGDCAQHREQIAWFENRPLLGQTIAVTRPVGQSVDAADAIRQLGAEPVPMPLLDVGPPDDWQLVDATIDRLIEFDWLIFTSVNGVSNFLDRLWDRGFDVRKLGDAKLAAIGPATAARLEQYHLRANLVPHEYRSESLADALCDRAVGQRVLWIGADRGRDILPERLIAAGATFEKVAVYRSGDATELPADTKLALAAGTLDWVPLSSPAMARQFAELIPTESRGRVRLASISPVTTAAAIEAGLTITAEAKVYTWEGLLAAIVETCRTGDS